jgi:hypothetical protein
VITIKATGKKECVFLNAACLPPSSNRCTFYNAQSTKMLARKTSAMQYLSCCTSLSQAYVDLTVSIIDNKS